MTDIWSAIVTAAFFALTWGAIAGCDALVARRDEEPR